MPGYFAWTIIIICVNLRKRHAAVAKGWILTTNNCSLWNFCTASEAAVDISYTGKISIRLDHIASRVCNYNWMVPGKNHFWNFQVHVRIHPNFASRPVWCEKMFLCCFSLKAGRKDLTKRSKVLSLQSPPPPPPHSTVFCRVTRGSSYLVYPNSAFFRRKGAIIRWYATLLCSCAVHNGLCSVVCKHHTLWYSWLCDHAVTVLCMLLLGAGRIWSATCWGAEEIARAGQVHVEREAGLQVHLQPVQVHPARPDGQYTHYRCWPKNGLYPSTDQRNLSPPDEIH